MSSHIRFIAITLAASGVCAFGLFCLTVRYFPDSENRILLQGPWDIRLESTFGQ